MDVYTSLGKAPDSWQTSSSDYDNQGPKLLATGIFLMSIGVLVMVGRIYCRAVILRKMGSDDWCMIFATIAALPILITNSIGVGFGLGRHTWTLPVEARQKTRMLGYIAMIHYFIALGLTKSSLLLFLIRLTPASRLSRISWFILVFVVLYTIVAFVLSVVQCIPISYIWEYLSPSAPTGLVGTCLPQRPLNYTLSPINIATDIIIWLLPLKTIWNIQMQPKQKCALLIIFSLGSMSVLAGILRLLSVEKSITSTDPTWDNLNLGIWSLVEVLVGIICGSAPAIKPLFSRFLPNVFGGSSPKTSSNNQRNLRPFPGIRCCEQPAYALGSINEIGIIREQNSSTEEFGPKTRIEGRGIKASSRNGSEEFNQEDDLGIDGIFKCTEVQVKVEERV